MSTASDLQAFRAELNAIAASCGGKYDENIAKKLDKSDPLRKYREQFTIPKIVDLGETDETDKSVECIYMCGHSLGLPPKNVENYMEKVLGNWKKLGAESHFHGYLPSEQCELIPKPLMAKIVGAKENEVVIMNTLTVNIHLMLYAIKSHLTLHGRPKSDLITLKPDKNGLLDENKLLELIQNDGDSIAVMLLPGTHYYTGQVLDIQRITHEAQKKGCLIIWDLAHSAGNTKLCLDKWNVDVAVWCSYKYLNSGAGGIGGVYVNEKHFSNEELPILRGWWGNNRETKFRFSREFERVPDSADMFKLSNTSPLLIAGLMASLEICNWAILYLRNL